MSRVVIFLLLYFRTSVCWYDFLFSQCEISMENPWLMFQFQIYFSKIQSQTVDGSPFSLLFCHWGPFLPLGHTFFTHHVQILLTSPIANTYHNKGLNHCIKSSIWMGDLVECALPFLYYIESITSMIFHRLIIL